MYNSIIGSLWGILSERGNNGVLEKNSSGAFGPVCALRQQYLSLPPVSFSMWGKSEMGALPCLFFGTYQYINSRRSCRAPVGTKSICKTGRYFVSIWDGGKLCRAAASLFYMKHFPSHPSGTPAAAPAAKDRYGHPKPARILQISPFQRIHDMIQYLCNLKCKERQNQSDDIGTV